MKIIKRQKTATERLRKNIATLVEQGLSVNGIAKTLNLTPDGIRYHLDCMGLKTHAQRKRVERRGTIKADLPYSTIDPESPITAARDILGSRLTEKNGSFWLDDCPSCLDDVMRAANVIRKRHGMIQLGNNVNWRV